MITRIYIRFVSILNTLRDLPLLLFRLILAYGFYEPARRKLENLEQIVDWFAKLGIPFPTINAYLATATENVGYVLLFLGLGTRLISIPLMVVMIVAIVTVHWKHGFPCGKNGFEVPLYYFLMLFALLVYGPGRVSLDWIIKRMKKKESNVSV